MGDTPSKVIDFASLPSEEIFTCLSCNDQHNIEYNRRVHTCVDCKKCTQANIGYGGDVACSHCSSYKSCIPANGWIGRSLHDRDKFNDSHWCKDLKAQHWKPKSSEFKDCNDCGKCNIVLPGCVAQHYCLCDWCGRRDHPTYLNASVPTAPVVCNQCNYAPIYKNGMCRNCECAMAHAAR